MMYKQLNHRAMEAHYQTQSNMNILHLTDYDLDYSSRNKSFDQISLSDFNYSITDAVNASYVYFIDLRNRKKGWWKRFLGLDKTPTKVKRLLP